MTYSDVTYRWRYLQSSYQNTEAVIHRFSIKRLFWKFSKFYMKTPVSGSLFNKITGMQLATLIQERLQSLFFVEQIRCNHFWNCAVLKLLKTAEKSLKVFTLPIYFEWDRQLFVAGALGDIIQLQIL